MVHQFNTVHSFTQAHDWIHRSRTYNDNWSLYRFI